MVRYTPFDARSVGPYQWELLKNFFVCDLDYHGLLEDSLGVPSGFDTDLESIPKLAQAIYRSAGDSRFPAVLHDWLYCVQICSRKTADTFFLYLLKESGVSYVKRYMMYWAVRLGGGIPWNKRKKNVQEIEYYRSLASINSIELPEFLED